MNGKTMDDMADELAARNALGKTKSFQDYTAPSSTSTSTSTWSSPSTSYDPGLDPGMKMDPRDSRPMTPPHPDEY